MFNSIKEFRDDPSLSAKLFAFCHLLHEQRPKIPEEQKETIISRAQRKISENLDYTPPLVTRNKALSIYSGTGNDFSLLKVTLQQKMTLKQKEHSLISKRQL